LGRAQQAQLQQAQLQLKQPCRFAARGEQLCGCGNGFEPCGRSNRSDGPDETSFSCAGAREDRYRI